MSSIVFGGIISGCLYALVAIGLILIYRTSRAINFAQADIGSVGTFLAVALTSGAAVRLGTGPAVGVGVLASAVLSVAVYLAVVLPLERRGADKFTTMVATVGVSLVIQGVLQWRFGYNARTIHVFPSSADVTMAGVRVPAAGIAIVATAVVTLLVLAFVLFRTRVGLVLRMGGSDLTLTSLSGVSVVALRIGVWAVAGALGAWAVTLYASYQYIDPTVSSGLLLSSAVAASWGAFRSIPWTLAGAVVLGILADLATRFAPVAVTETVSLVVLVVVFRLLQRGRGTVSGRINVLAKATESVRSVYAGARRRAVVESAALVAALIVLVVVLDLNSIGVLDQVMTSFVVLLGLAVSVRYSGRLNLASCGFLAIGAYVSAVLDGAMPSWSAAVVALAVSALVGAGVGLVTAGLEEIFYVQISLLLTAAAPELIVLAKRWTSGNSGLSVDGYFAGSDVGMPVVILVCLAVALAVVVGFGFLRTGRRTLTAAADTRVAQSLGIRPGRWYVLTEALAGCLMGLGGVLSAHDSQFVDPSSFTVYQSMLYLMVLVMAGGWSPVGLALAAALFVLLPDVFSGIGQLPPILIGAVVVAVVLVSPDGVESWLPRVYRTVRHGPPANTLRERTPEAVGR